MLSLIGRQIGEFKIIEEIGRGGMGTVYLGIDTELNRKVAIKMLNPALTSDSSIEKRFMQEAKILANLKHPNVVTIYRQVRFEGMCFLVMEFMEGQRGFGFKPDRSLEDLIKSRGALDEETIVKMFGQVLSALDYAHKRKEKVIHRDIKPSNILIANEETVKLADFGIAKILTDKTGHSVTGTRIGTLYYMSPEQIEGKAVDERSDIYALGVTLYEMATGKVPFEGDSDFKIMEAHLRTPPKPPREVNPGVSEKMEKIILKAMEKKPADRYQSVKEFARDLETVLEKEPESVPKPKIEHKEEEDQEDEKLTIVDEDKTEKIEKPVYPPSRKRKRSPVGWILLGVGAVAALIVIIVIATSGPPTPPEPEISTMPRLVGVTESSAKSRLQNLDASVSSVDYIYTDAVSKGQVVWTSPFAGSEITGSVKLTVSKGRKTCPKCGKERKSDWTYCGYCGAKID